MIILSLWSCTGADPKKDTGPETFRDYPVLERVSATCTEEMRFDIRGRTRGWTERGIVQIWEATQDPYVESPYAELKLWSTGDFAEDESCDIVAIEGALVLEDTELPARCVGDFDTSYTALIRVVHERGCAGERWVGFNAEGWMVQDDNLVDLDPTALDEDCPPPYDDDWFAEPPPMEEVAVESVGSCADGG